MLEKMHRQQMPIFLHDTTFKHAFPVCQKQQNKIYKRKRKPTCLSLCKAVKIRPGRDIIATPHMMILQNKFTCKLITDFNNSVHRLMKRKTVFTPNMHISLRSEKGLVATIIVAVNNSAINAIRSTEQVPYVINYLSTSCIGILLSLIFNSVPDILHN